MSHSLFAPSAAHRWLRCPGSVSLCADIPNPSSVYADEGTAAHTVAARALTYNKPAAFFIGEEIQAGERVFIVTDEMAAYVQVYLDDVRQRVGGGMLLHEQRVSFAEAIGVPDQGGTADAVILSEDFKRLTVCDLKYGMGVQVFAEDNEQMLTYAVGVLETHGAVLGDEIESITLVIVQPRLDHIDEFTYPIAKLQEHVRRLNDAAANALCPAPTFQPGEKQCKFCPAKATCDEYRRHVSEAVLDDGSMLDEPDGVMVLGELPIPAGEKLGKMFGVLQLIEDWCKGVRAEVERQVFAGMSVIGPDDKPMKLIEGRRGNRMWADPATAEGVLAGLLAADKIYKPRELISPAAADKLVPKPMRETLSTLVKQAPGKVKVALGSDPAPTYTGAAQPEEFEVLPE